jgi:Spy/CpxP family protein refolding chaperone
VTSATEAASASMWRGRGVLIALALSITLNVFVLGGLMWSMVAPPPSPPTGNLASRLNAAARRLELSPEQRQAFRHFAADARAVREELRQNNAPVMRQIWAEMAKPQPDQAAINNLSDQAVENRRAYQRKMATNLMTFLGSLTPEQRERFATFAMRRPAAPP